MDRPPDCQEGIVLVVRQRGAAGSNLGTGTGTMVINVSMVSNSRFGNPLPATPASHPSPFGFGPARLHRGACYTARYG